MNDKYALHCAKQQQEFVEQKEFAEKAFEFVKEKASSNGICAFDNYEKELLELQEILNKKFPRSNSIREIVSQEKERLVEMIWGKKVKELVWGEK